MVDSLNIGMKNFKEFVIEANTPSLFIWDIDETLMQTSAKIYVRKNGKVVRTLSNTEYNTYVKQPDETLDFSEFRRADIFQKTSKPYMNLMRVASRLLRVTLNNPGSRMIIVTARSDFDDRETFLDTFRQYGLNMRHIYVERSGNLGLPTAEGKRVTIEKYLSTGQFANATLFDDADSNLAMFLGLQKKYPKINLHAYKAEHGTLRKVK